MTTPRLPAVLTCLTVAAIALSGCSSGSPSPSGAPAAVVDGGTATFAVSVEPSCFDPHQTSEIAADPILHAIFDTLVHQRNDGTFEPALATNWTVSDNGLDYTFDVRDDVTFHDATPFDAHAVAANVVHVLQGPAGSNTKIVSVLNADDPVTVVDDDTVVIHLATASAGFLNQVANVGLAIVSPAALEAHGTELCSAQGLVGTGPFEFVSRTAGNQVELTRNDEYAWAPASLSHDGPAYLENLVIQFQPEAQTRIGSLTSGQVQAAGDIPPTLVSQVESGRAQVERQDIAGTSYSLFLNTHKGPFADEEVRKAFQLSLDVGDLVEAVYQGQFDRAWSVSAPGLPDAYDASLENSWPQDSAEAERLLAAAGYTQKDSEGYWVRDGERLRAHWLFNSSAVRELRDILADAIVDNAKQHGFEVILDAVDTGTYTARRAANDYDIGDQNSQNPDGDSLRSPLFFSTVQVVNGGAGLANLQSPEVDSWLTAANQTIDPEVRAENYDLVQHYLIDHAVVVPLYVPAYLLARAADTDGWDFSLRGVPYNFYNVHYTEEG